MRKQLSLAVGLFVAAIAMGRTVSAAPPTESRDVGFIKTVAEDNRFEEKIGRYAQEHAVTQEVKDLGRHLVDDHNKAGDRLHKLAKDENVDLKDDGKLTPSDQAVYDRVTGKKGVDFDREFTKLMISRHQDVIHQFELQRDHTHDTAVKDFAANELPHLKDHLDMAKSAQKKIVGA